MPEPPYTAWLGKAANDYLAIHNEVSAVETPWDVVCFHAQQCAEKMLKALLVLHEEMPPRTHDLRLLLRRCLAINTELADLEADCLSLTTHAVGPRYPEELSDVGEDEARDVLAALERVRTRLLPLFPPNS